MGVRRQHAAVVLSSVPSSLSRKSLNTADEEQLKGHHQVRGLPTLSVFSCGGTVFQRVGRAMIPPFEL
jgi:hypothetical protein